MQEDWVWAGRLPRLTQAGRPAGCQGTSEEESGARVRRGASGRLENRRAEGRDRGRGWREMRQDRADFRHHRGDGHINQSVSDGTDQARMLGGIGVRVEEAMQGCRSRSQMRHNPSPQQDNGHRAPNAPPTCREMTPTYLQSIRNRAQGPGAVNTFEGSAEPPGRASLTAAQILCKT